MIRDGDEDLSRDEDVAEADLGTDHPLGSGVPPSQAGLPLDESGAHPTPGLPGVPAGFRPTPLFVPEFGGESFAASTSTRLSMFVPICG